MPADSKCEGQKAVREFGSNSSEALIRSERDFAPESPKGVRESNVHSRRVRLGVQESIANQQAVAQKVALESISPMGVQAPVEVPGDCWFVWVPTVDLGTWAIVLAV